MENQCYSREPHWKLSKKEVKNVFHYEESNLEKTIMEIIFLFIIYEKPLKSQVNTWGFDIFIKLYDRSAKLYNRKITFFLT